MNIKSYTKNDALLAHIDLLGTSFLYERNTEPLEKQAEWLFRSLIAIFDTEFENSFDKSEIRDFFCVNIYADSIMIHLTTDEDRLVVKLIEFLLKFQYELIFAQPSEIGPVPCIALVDRQPYFAIRVESPEEGSILHSELTSCSLCGGKGMIEMGKKRTTGLPVGVYVSKQVVDKLDGAILERRVPVKEDALYFIKQHDLELPLLFSQKWRISSQLGGETLEDILKNASLDGVTKYEDSKWRQWIDVHEKKAFEIHKSVTHPFS